MPITAIDIQREHGQRMYAQGKRMGHSQAASYVLGLTNLDPITRINLAFDLMGLDEDGKPRTPKTEEPKS